MNWWILAKFTFVLNHSLEITSNILNKKIIKWLTMSFGIFSILL